MNYLDRNQVSQYIALEPNTLMHPHIRRRAQAAGFTEASGTLLILSSPAEDTSSILSSIPHPVDTLISILTLCSVPSPQDTLRSLVCDVLKPGGQFLFYEHVLNSMADVAWWQRFWAPFWKPFFDGCRMDQPTHLWVEELGVDGYGKAKGNGSGVWREGETWKKEGENEDNLFCHRIGKFIKV